MFRTFTRVAAAATVAAVALAGPRAAQAQDIVETAVAAGQFTTLAKALTEAGLVETLKGAGPFTVFAPTDAAFAKLPAGTVEGLLADLARNRGALSCRRPSLLRLRRGDHAWCSDGPDRRLS